MKTKLTTPSLQQINSICNQEILAAAHDELEFAYGPMPQEPSPIELEKFVGRFVEWDERWLQQFKSRPSVRALFGP